jgi:Lipid A 3-O-deacylase (PagL)
VNGLVPAVGGATRHAVVTILASVAWVTLVAVQPVGAQAHPATTERGVVSAGTWQIGTYVAGARSSPGNGVLGTIPDRDHVLVGLQAGTTVLRLGSISVNYIAQVLPFVMIGDRFASQYDSLLDANRLARLPRRAYAFGVSPFGLEVTTPAARRMSGYLMTAGGGLLFTRAYPDVTGRRTNFTLEVGGGLRVRTRQAQWIQAGYKYHHLSNAGTAFANPGLDANLFYAGYQWAARLPR